MYYHHFNIRDNKIILVGNEQGISQLLINNDTKPVVIEKSWEQSEKPFAEAEKQLREYFEGKRTTFDLKLNPKGTDYQKQVWKTLMQIPYGELYSYKEVATMLGNPKASRAIGLANNRNPIPIIVPCHRVVGANKKLVGYAYGLELKQQLIDLEKINRVFMRLADHYGSLLWWPADHAFEMMVGAILTQNTNWKNVEKALANFGDKLTPGYITDTPADELAEMIRPSGYHNQKAVKLKALCDWFEKYNFDITKARSVDITTLRKELLAIHGVGPETADSILVYALDKPSFVIDAYTRRIFSRIGIDVPADYEAFRKKIEQYVPRDVKTYDYYHGLIVEHAKAFCTKNTPKCSNCPLKEMCSRKFESLQMVIKNL